jgi:hypothetical protein
MVNVIKGHFSRYARQPRGREFCSQLARDYALSRLKRGTGLCRQGRRRSFSAVSTSGSSNPRMAPAPIMTASISAAPGLTKALESLIVGFVVDVEQNSNIVHLHLDDSIRVTPEDRPAADVSAEGHDLGED